MSCEVINPTAALTDLVRHIACEITTHILNSILKISQLFYALYARAFILFSTTLTHVDACRTAS